MIRALYLTIFTCLAFPGLTIAQSPTVEQALGLKPTQHSKTAVDFSTPTPDEYKDCSIESADSADGAGWLVYDPQNRLLRRFIDTNKDKKIDMWCYYKNGIEVYRDIDSDFDEAVDQCRWLGTAGTRWGIDQNQDEQIDSWKQISAEEISLEVVESIRNSDSRRFMRLLPSEDEINQLGVGEQLTEEISNRISRAKSEFQKMASQQTSISKASQWVQFSGAQPGTIPAGSDGSNDLIIYDNAAAVIDTEGKHGQIALGSIIKVGNAWRLIDLPQPIVEGEPLAIGGLFFYMQPGTASGRGVSAIAVSTANQALFSEFEKIEEGLQKATSRPERIKLHEQRVAIIAKIVSAAKGEERSNWIRQYADTVTGAYQSDELPNGLEYLTEFVDRLKRSNVEQEDVGYVAFRMINARFTEQLSQGNKDDIAKIQKQYINDLTSFVSEYRKSDLCADAMLQLALSAEFSDGEDDAKTWYEKIVNDFGNLPVAKKAQGALIRLNSEGKAINLSGTALNNRPYKLSDSRGKVIVIHYWATWCEPCKEDIKKLQELYTTYNRQGLEIVGLNLDEQKDSVVNFLRTNRMPWIQLHEPGGLESPLAEQLGVVTLPTMMLIGKNGQVIDRSVSVSELDRKIKQEIR